MKNLSLVWISILGFWKLFHNVLAFSGIFLNPFTDKKSGCDFFFFNDLNEAENTERCVFWFGFFLHFYGLEVGTNSLKVSAVVDYVSAYDCVPGEKSLLAFDVCNLERSLEK